LNLFDPALSQVYHFEGNVHDLVVYGDYLAVAVGGVGLEIFHRDRPETRLRYAIDSELQERAGRAVSLKLYGSLLFVASDTGILVLDLAQPMSPRVVSAGNVEKIKSVDIYKDRLIAGGGDAGLALFELAQDYMAAGLLDRAELLFREVIEHDVNREQALRGLSDIYQQERDWLKCLEVAERLKPLTERPMGVEIAHYHCELAEEARRAGDIPKAHKHLARAQQADPGGVRSTMIEGRMALEAGSPQRALDLFLRVADQGPPFLPEILPELVQAFGALGQEETPVLESLAARYPSPPLLLCLSKAIERERGAAAAIDALTRYLAGHVDLAALERLLSLQSEAPSPADEGRLERDQVVHQVVRHLLARQSPYQCNHCGFQARSLHWRCPSCKRWGTVQPVQPERIPGNEVLQGPRIA
jgi:lipopolysaccharide biosynthesis regulator YciM